MKDYDYSRIGMYFITICTHKKTCILGNIDSGGVILSELGRMAEELWSTLPERFSNINLDEFVIMPNHLHAIINITTVGAIHELPRNHKLPAQNNRSQRRKMLIPRIIGYFKMNSANKINQLRHSSGKPVWQRNYYEHVVRNENELNRIRKYIQVNPMDWHLDVENPERINNQNR